MSVARNEIVEFPLTFKGTLWKPLLFKEIDNIFKPMIIKFCVRIKKYKHLPIFNCIDFTIIVIQETHPRRRT
jgi:hypothetical protein